EATSTRSPGDTMFVTADSIAYVPDPGITSTSLPVMNTRLRPASVSANRRLKSGLRWWISGRAIAACTSGGTGVGPGVIRYVFSGTASVYRRARRVHVRPLAGPRRRVPGQRRRADRPAPRERL